jgi:ribose transport system permease protein
MAMELKAARRLSLAACVSTGRRIVAEYPIVVMVALFIVLAIATNIASPGFLLPGNLSTALLVAAPLGILAAGQTMVILTAGIDLSVTATATIAAYYMVQHASVNEPESIAVALLLGIVVGMVNGIGAGCFGVSPLIMTLGMSGILSGIIYVWATSSSSVPLVPTFIHEAGADKWFGVLPIGMVIWAVFAVLLIGLLRGTGFGRAVYAVGANPVASQLAGVRTWQVLLAVYTLCGFLSAVAGILLAGYLGNVDTGMATSYQLQTIAAVVIGGTSILGGSGGYGGSIIGVLILTVLGSLLNILNASEALRQILYGLVVLALAWTYARTTGAD